MLADDDLPWYWGTGDKTLAGDSGLRSTTGVQVALLQASVLSDDARHDRAMARVDPWRRLDDPRWAREGWQRNPSQHATVDASQVEDGVIGRLLDMPRAGEVEERLAAIPRVHARALVLHFTGKSLPFAVDPAAVMLASAQVDGRELKHEELRALLKDDAALAQRLDEEAKAVVLAAKVAYEGVHVEHRRRLQVGDPREGQRDSAPEGHVREERCASGKVWYEGPSGKDR